MTKLMIIALSVIILTLNSCKDNCYTIEKQMVSVADYGDLATVLNSFEVQPARTIKKPGNIYTFGNYLFVCEHEKGIHILDNTNPSNPTGLKFIKLEGNDNIAVKANFLYADNGTRLLTLDINDLNNIKIVNSIDDVFSERIQNGKLIVGYHFEEKLEKVPCNTTTRSILLSKSDQQLMTSSAESSGVGGKGGSLARFAIVDNYLYIAKFDKFIPFNISNLTSPIKGLALGFPNSDAETCFPYKDYLFFGASSGVYIYNYKKSPESPAWESTINHIVGCDPVVAQGEYAFSTIRDGAICRTRNGQNSLFVFDIKNIKTPKDVSTTQQKSPYGLGIKGNLLFVCNGLNGLFVYDWNEATETITPINSYPDIHAFDVIINGNTLIVTADNGLFQFDCSNPNNIRYLSTLAQFN